MKHLDLFSGIGGFSLATEMVWDDIEHVFCDNEPFAQAVLTKHWPNAKIYGDIRTLTADTERERFQGSRNHQYRELQKPTENSGQAECIDLITGGFPCQPFSQAGQRRGTADDRHLWPEMLRVIREFHARWVIGENVGGLVTWSEGLVLEQIHADLEGEGYEVQAFVIPAVALNAPHRRDRVWIVAHSTSNGRGTEPRDIQEKNGRPPKFISKPGSAVVGNTKHDGFNGSQDREGSTQGNDGDQAREKQVQQPKRPNRRGDYPPNWNQHWLEVATRLCRVDDGIPRRLDRTPRLKALGNAIVPQVAAEIMKVIKEIDEAQPTLI